MTSATQTPPLRVAGGSGAVAAALPPFQALRRATLATLLWQDKAYESGSEVAKEIQRLIPQCSAQAVADLAVEIRTKQGIRSTPLFLLRELVRVQANRALVGEYLPKVIQRADEIPEFLAMYWKDGKQPLASQVKKGLRVAFNNFQEYHLSKYKAGGGGVSMRDAAFMVHVKPDASVRRRYTKAERAAGETPTPPLTGREVTFQNLCQEGLGAADTRESMLSQAKDSAGQRDGFIRLIDEKKLGALATLRNLRKMEEVGVPTATIRQAIRAANPERLLPGNFWQAAIATPQYRDALEELMGKCMARYRRLPGTTLFVVDCSGSMASPVSKHSTLSRLHAGLSLAKMAQMVCDKSHVFLTGDSTVPVTSPLVLGEIPKERGPGGYGGIYTARCVNYLKERFKAEDAERLIIISDSQDCEYSGVTPAPHWKKNYLVDVSSHTLGINYRGVWTAEIAGWSPAFIEYFSEFEFFMPTIQMDLF